ncbi:MAG: tagaturonate epimerase family protein [Bryobacteraceae bacterium]
MTLEKYSFGVGDRFAHQAAAQLRACMMAAGHGVEIVPVWNKSNREHNIIGSEPVSTRAAADAAVASLGWTKSYYVDADHINLTTVDRFVAVSDFFTIDVADYIGKPAGTDAVEAFAARHPELTGEIRIEGIAEPFQVSPEKLRSVTTQYLYAVTEAGKIYRHIEAVKGKGQFVPEVSMDETDAPQTPDELIIILAAIADEGIPIQTIAPKFTGRFNKGVDYVGDAAQFEREFRNDLAVIAHAIGAYGLPANLKLSVHSGSDKFSIYAPIRRALRDTGAGVHLKTAGTTWLEELIGMAEAGGAGLELAREVYADAFGHQRELCEPYASVIDIDAARLPDPAVVRQWTGAEYASALRHDQSNSAYNADLRQLLHVGYKVAAKMGERYLEQLRACESDISRNVTTNLFERHIRPLFLD